jgi:hypothetical protein
MQFDPIRRTAAAIACLLMFQPVYAQSSAAAPSDGSYRVRTEVTMITGGKTYCTGPDFVININGGEVDVPNRKAEGMPITLRGPLNGNSFDIFTQNSTGGVHVKGTINNGQVTTFESLSHSCNYHYP